MRLETTNFIKAFRYLAKLESKGPQDFEANFDKVMELSKYTLLGEWFAEKISTQNRANESKGTSRFASTAFTR
jgi:hypothetical protein